ncbi:hypothetical protein KY092_11695 [Natronomonas gomsonensis]|uniref:hypothetical protein n=1 Tax=Natronomonas gomsonensis TaxID=1046043 RepID=UPI0020CA2FC4|nr:hypothetical protein [Natronomonas gomsonensis]MCY4731216.1 hypothetical protein [Natronomonas gomsonensis]
MTFADDERGQPVVIGALLIFTILILAFAGYQAFAVPNQNAEVEFNHFQDVQSDFAELESNLVNAVESGDTRSASIDLGPQYPSRMLALNPPPAAGSLRTTEAGEVSIIESGSSVSVCRDGGTATSRSLVYRPGYAEFDNANSIVYENRFTTRQFREGNIFGDQRLVESASGNDRINLLLLTGEVSENAVGVSNIEINATSRYRTTVSNPTITLPSRFSAGEWEDDILSDRTDVTASDVGTNQVELDFDGGDYRVSCAVAGLNGEPAFSPPGPSNPATGGNATYNVQWDTTKIINENSQVRDSATEDIEVDSGSTVNSPGFFVDVTNRNSGAPVNDVVIDAGHSGGIVSNIDDSDALTGSDGTDGETPGFKIVFESVDDTGVLYASGGDDIDTITVDVVAASFESLVGDSSASGKSGNPNEATFDFTLTTQAQVTFEIIGGQSKTRNVQSGTIDIKPQGEKYPLELRASISGGECLRTTLSSASETARLSDGDWVECTN